ncbi:MAG: hypothetical protein ACKOQ6_13750 [Bacteroidota bacterium]
MSIRLFVALFFFSIRLSAQLPYTLPAYPFDTVNNVVYGWDTTFSGAYEPLIYDMYRPLGDGNCLRPVAVVIHGGAWIAGTQRDPNVVYFASELAKRGWLVVAPQYRLGNHKITNYNMYALCNASLANPCAYALDSSEVIRANYRAMQDIKGLLRYLSGRALQDSSDMNNLFLVGESAGGFIALTTAFTDRTSEKSVDAGLLPNAPFPDADMYAYGCLPASSDFSRPDLGGIQGDLLMQFPDPFIRGVASIYGGVFDSSIFINNGVTPRVFLFHQGSDVIVDYDYGRLLSRISAECFAPTNYCQPIYNYPYAWGGEGVRRIFSNMGPLAPFYRAEIVSNYEYGNDCFDNGHSIDAPALRFAQVLQFFSEAIDTTVNHAPNACPPSSVPQVIDVAGIRVFSDATTIHISWEGPVIRDEIVLLSVDGKKISTSYASGNSTRMNATGLTSGIYIIRFIGAGISKRIFLK